MGMNMAAMIRLQDSNFSVVMGLLIERAAIKKAALGGCGDNTLILHYVKVRWAVLDDPIAVRWLWHGPRQQRRGICALAGTANRSA